MEPTDQTHTQTAVRFPAGKSPDGEQLYREINYDTVEEAAGNAKLFGGEVVNHDEYVNEDGSKMSKAERKAHDKAKAEEADLQAQIDAEEAAKAKTAAKP